MAGADVALEGVSKKYELSGGPTIAALDDFSLLIPSGQMIAITGPSGSGKSTLLHLVGAMDRSDSGSIRVGDYLVSELTAREAVEYRRTIGFVFQRFHLLQALTVIDNVLAPILLRKTKFDKVERASSLLSSVGLLDRQDALPSTLSGGQQQRVAIARALINDPGLLLADEPTGNLDSTTGAEITELLTRLREQRGTTVILATHDPVIGARCDRLVRVQDGKLVEDIDVLTSESPEVLLNRIGWLGPGV